MPRDKNNKSNFRAKKPEKEFFILFYFPALVRALKKQLKSGDGTLALESDVRQLLPVIADRLRRELARREKSGRPRSLSVETLKAISAKLERRGRKWMVKGGGSIEDVCQSFGTTYKTFWRVWNKKEQEKQTLDGIKEQIKWLKKLNKSDVIVDTASFTPLEEIVKLVKKLPEFSLPRFSKTRLELIAQLRREGKSTEELGKIYGLPESGISYILKQSKK